MFVPLRTTHPPGSPCVLTDRPVLPLIAPLKYSVPPPPPRETVAAGVVSVPPKVAEPIAPSDSPLDVLESTSDSVSLTPLGSTMAPDEFAAIPPLESQLPIGAYVS